MAARKHLNCRAFDDKAYPPKIVRVFVRFDRKWIPIGDICLRCHEVWPHKGMADVEEAAAAA